MPVHLTTTRTMPQGPTRRTMPTGRRGVVAAVHPAHARRVCGVDCPGHRQHQAKPAREEMSKRRAVLLLRERFRSSFFAHHRDRRTSIHSPQAVSPHCSSVAPYSSSSSGASPRPGFLAMEHGLWSSGASDKNKAMVEQLQRYGVIKSTKVAEVMDTIDRGLFVPPGASPYFDSPMAIGYNATISAPHMHAACLELLEDHLQPGMRALDVGSGTGYLTACFALMVGPEGQAVGVEHIPELVASSTENIKKSAAAPQLKDGSLSIHIADGREGWPELAPYDCIHVGAAAPQIPEALIEQLKPGGRMVIPVGTVFQELKVVDKKLDGTVSVRDETSVRYVPLTSKDAQLHSN